MMINPFLGFTIVHFTAGLLLENFTKPMSEIKVLFIGIGKPAPSFIKNRILQLDKTGQIKATVVMPSDCIGHFNLDYGVTLSEYPLRFSIWNTVLPLIWFSLTCPWATLRLWHSLDCYSFRKRAKTFIKYHSLVRITELDLIHLQWISMASEMRWIKGYLKVPVISSARGSQLTVYPSTLPNYIKQINESIAASDYIHAVSLSMAEACNTLGANPEKVFVNYNGIEIGKYCEINRNENAANILNLVSTGSLIWRKGFLWQLMLAKLLKDNGLNVRLNIIGDGPDKQGLQYSIIRLKLQKEVTLTGNLSSEEVIKNLQSADIYVSTSAAEGLSNAVLEAVACGLPVVAFDCEGMQEVIENGHNGFIVPFGDIESMLEKVGLLNNDRKLMQSMGHRGSVLASERFDYKVHVQKMIDFYRLVSSKNE